MPMKQTGRKVHRSMQGKQVDMDLLRQRNELTPAVGNARVNARGEVDRLLENVKKYYVTTMLKRAECLKSWQ
jgi:hypothetical protein